MTRTLDIDSRTVLNLIGVLVVVGAVAPFVVTAAPQVVGANHSYTVLSSSMSPHIKAGDVVVDRDVAPANVHVGDVVTFHPPASDGFGNAKRVTHRVVDVVHKNGKRYYRTKGDANDAADPGLVPASSVVGVVWFHIPKIGYVTQFANTPLGLVSLVVIPLFLLACSEAYDFLTDAAVDPDADVEE